MQAAMPPIKILRSMVLLPMDRVEWKSGSVVASWKGRATQGRAFRGRASQAGFRLRTSCDNNVTRHAAVEWVRCRQGLNSSEFAANANSGAALEAAADRAGTGDTHP